jgi:hypothetical protein
LRRPHEQRRGGHACRAQTSSQELIGPKAAQFHGCGKKLVGDGGLMKTHTELGMTFEDCLGCRLKTPDSLLVAYLPDLLG